MERHCRICKSAFNAAPSRIAQGKGHYCSRQCYRAAVERTEKRCDRCGDVIPETGWHHEAKFCSRACYHARKGSGHNWRGGRVIDKDGYARVWAPDSPMARADGYVTEHRLVMSEHIGRLLLPTEVVHHENLIRDDNRIENLRLFATHAEHMKHHAPSWLSG